METPKDIATVMQIFTPIGARYLFPDKKNLFLIGDFRGGYRSMLGLHVLESSNWYVTLRLIVFEIFAFLEGLSFGF